MLAATASPGQVWDLGTLSADDLRTQFLGHAPPDQAVARHGQFSERGAIHFHMLCLDGAYVMEQGRPRFRRVPPPTPAELEALLRQITHRIARHLERRGLLVQDAESGDLEFG